MSKLRVSVVEKKLARKKSYEPKEVADRPVVMDQVRDLASSVGIWAEDEFDREFQKASSSSLALVRDQLAEAVEILDVLFSKTHLKTSNGFAEPSAEIIKALSIGRARPGPYSATTENITSWINAIGFLRARVRMLVGSGQHDHFDTMLIGLSDIWIHHTKQNIDPAVLGTLSSSPFIEFSHHVLVNLLNQGGDETQDLGEISAESLAYRWRRLKSQWGNDPRN
jgi:hypothetical protein